MKNKILLATVLSVLVSPLVWADVTTKTGNFDADLVKVEVDSTGNTTVAYRRTDEKAWSKAKPFTMTGVFTFSWDSAKPTAVDFTGTTDFGTFSSDTHAKVAFMNIKSTQTFYDYVQNVTGTAKWDAATRTLTHVDKPKGDDRRDDGRASTVEQSKPAICVEADSRACKAFFKTSPELEGLKMKLTFNEDLSSYEGRIVMIQFGGKGMEAAETEIIIGIKGNLADK